jgi:hypothetical protein
VKIKIVGFKVGQSRPTANRSFSSNLIEASAEALAKSDQELGAIIRALFYDETDFISIRKVDD